MVTTNPQHKIWAFLMLMAFFSSIHAASSGFVTTSLSAANLNATDAGPPMITMPIRNIYNQGYNVVLSDNTGQNVTVGLEGFQPHLWLINANKVLDCSVLNSVAPSNSTSGSTYATRNCHSAGAGYTPMTTTTVSSGSHIKTVTTVATAVPTTALLNITYPYINYASGYFTNANLTLDTLGNNSTGGDGLSLGSVLYLLVNDTNDTVGKLGLAGPSRAGSVFDTLKWRGLTYGNGYSMYLFNQSSEFDLSGYLLLGSVDQNLYSGDFYAFPQIPHTGWSNPNAILPILQLDTVSLVNLDNSQLASLYNAGSFPVVLGFNSNYSALPRSLIISLALQTNAFYVSSLDAWVFNCSAVSNINASLKFAFGPLSVDIPLSSVVLPALDGNLTFLDGLPACVFNIFPSETVGSAVIGASILQGMYFAMDNEGGLIAAANANTNLNPDLLLTASQNSSTVGYIRSSYIPFATSALISSGLTFTFGSFNTSALASNPAALTNAVITSNHVYISLKKISSARASVAASAASAKSTSGGAGSFNNYLRERSHSVVYVILLIGGIMGLMFV